MKTSNMFDDLRHTHFWSYKFKNKQFIRIKVNVFIFLSKFENIAFKLQNRVIFEIFNLLQC